ncbi:ATP-binding protein [Pseudoalteromonas arctica]|uniref:ATP-binding protein n=1 Tax=Pseudoalteromonas arctica TaxID=394751 RepID=A0A7Y0DWV0_9GAMM|nr:ATP-binding protein [Pseudoalteromonas arctica]NMM42256.1 hypothetical protein [Pseudoalteromonas arctica]
MSSASIKFSGNLIEELSQKIPSSLFALNELIKNAYDAFSPDVVIRITPSNQTISIIDQGYGMGEEEIKSLFHISKSTKRYGHEVEHNGIKRLTQGSKGLGFLSAFKFGDKVEWATSKGGTRSNFTVCKSELVAKEDVAGTAITITTEPDSKCGTTITVHSDKAQIDELLNDLNGGDNRVIEKLAATIIDDSFDIKIEIEHKQEVVSTRSLKPFTKENEDSQLFYVNYDSSKNEIEFYHKGEHLKSISHALMRTDYSINIELIIFHFQKGKNSKSVSALNRRVHDDALYPLIYMNNNLFNNTIIFNPELLRKKKSGETLPQMIGRVGVVSKSSEMEFNSDRTNFVENNVTRGLLKDLEQLNRLIQTEGAELKKGLKKGQKTPTGKAVPESEQRAEKSGVASIFFDRSKPNQFYVPSEQM